MKHSRKLRRLHALLGYFLDHGLTESGAWHALFQADSTNYAATGYSVSGVEWRKVAQGPRPVGIRPRVWKR